MSKIIVVKNQIEIDALPDQFDEYTNIEIRSEASVLISIKKTPGNSSVVAMESSSVVAMESSSVVAMGSSRVMAWGSSSVVAMGSSRVEAWESSSVVAMGSSRVEAWGSSRVEAWGSSSVVARGSSRVEAYFATSVHIFSPDNSVELFGQSVCFIHFKGKNKVKSRSKTANKIIVKEYPGLTGWLEKECVISEKTKVTLFKRVSKDFKTQENTKNETVWEVGKTLTVPNWNTLEECGPGKFHACSRAHFCDEFRSEKDDRYVAIEINKKDLFAFPEACYPHKIAFRMGRVAYECNRFGDKI